MAAHGNDAGKGGPLGQPAVPVRERQGDALLRALGFGVDRCDFRLDRIVRAGGGSAGREEAMGSVVRCHTQDQRPGRAVR